MIAFEVALLIVVGVVVVVALRAIAEPLTKAHAEKVKYKYRDLGSEAETILKQKVESLENEVITLKQQVAEVQQALDQVLKQDNAHQPARQSQFQTSEQS